MYNLLINSLQPVPLLHFFEINMIVLKMMQSDYMEIARYYIVLMQEGKYYNSTILCKVSVYCINDINVP